VAAPWEKYQSAAPAPSTPQGPWSKYAGVDFAGAFEQSPSGSVNPDAVRQSYDRSQTPDGIGDTLKRAGQNFLPSAQRFGSDIVSMVSDPVGTLQNVGNLAAGVAEKFVPGEQQHEKYANAVGSFFADRYGGMDNLKRTMANDPVGFLSDLSVVMSGGAGLAGKLPMLERAGRAASVAARAIDPINATLKAGKTAGRGVGNAVAAATGVTTGAGGQAIKTAAKAGYEGGQAASEFAANMRGAVPLDDVVAKAKAGVDAIRAERQAAYRAGMADLAKDQTVLDFSKIDQALNRTQPIKSFKGVSLQPSAANTTKEIATVLDQWRKLPAADFHTPEGFDALKQRLGDIVDGAERGSPSQKIATQVYNIVKDQITAQAPKYAKTMEGYSRASDLIKEIEGTLSLNRNARIDTKLRKLQSVMRNGVHTNYGKRGDLVKLLQDKGATNILAALAGQALNSLEPRGLARVGAAAAGGGAALLNPGTAVPLLASMVTTSPRIVGEAALGAGRLARLGERAQEPVRNSLRALYETRAAEGK
jgi:hypothetical protein